jgi:flavin reductase (DIM6/NTAB) family NADH-FMN oxidoreductase RutF
MTMQEDFGKITQETMKQLENGGAFLMTGEPVNPMTIGWLELGRSWNKPVATIFVRRSRFSYENLTKGSGRFTISVPAKGTFAKELAFCGTRSGRDTDKMKETGMETTPSQTDGVPGVKGCAIQIECRVLYATELMDLDRFDAATRAKMYDAKTWGQDGNPHAMFFAEILNMRRE